MGPYSVPVSTPRNVRRSITSRSVALLAPEPPAEQAADRYDGEACRSLPDGIWRFIQDPSVPGPPRGALFPAPPPVRVLPPSLWALGPRGGTGALCRLVLGAP